MTGLERVKETPGRALPSSSTTVTLRVPLSAEYVAEVIIRMDNKINKVLKLFFILFFSPFPYFWENFWLRPLTLYLDPSQINHCPGIKTS
jgi:hypothetical protein